MLGQILRELEKAVREGRVKPVVVGPYEIDIPNQRVRAEPGPVLYEDRLLGFLAGRPAVFDRFTAGKAGTLWYYGCLSDIFARRGVPVAEALTRAVNEMTRLAA